MTNSLRPKNWHGIQTLSDSLESLIDGHTLPVVLETISEICHGKAEHIAANWQDEPMAMDWTHAGNTVGIAAGRKSVTRTVP